MFFTCRDDGIVHSRFQLVLLAASTVHEGAADEGLGRERETGEVRVRGLERSLPLTLRFLFLRLKETEHIGVVEGKPSFSLILCFDFPHRRETPAAAREFFFLSGPLQDVAIPAQHGYGPKTFIGSS